MFCHLEFLIVVGIRNTYIYYEFRSALNYFTVTLRKRSFVIAPRRVVHIIYVIFI